ncbi:hypothetical protein Tco_1445738 [Tanacetum coccineum]
MKNKKLPIEDENVNPNMADHVNRSLCIRKNHSKKDSSSNNVISSNILYNNPHVVVNDHHESRNKRKSFMLIGVYIRFIAIQKAKCTKIKFVTKELTNTPNVTLIGEDLVPPKRKPGRPRKNPDDTSTIPNRAKQRKTNENQIPPLPNSRLATPLNVVTPLSKINLQRSPLSDITVGI